jgi:hypothetical protein
MRAYRIQGSALDRENDDLTVTRCGEQVVARSG